MFIIGRPKKIILADPKAGSLAFTASMLGAAEDIRIVAECDNDNQMYHAIAKHPGSIVLFAASMQLDLARLCILLETTGSYGIVFTGDIGLADSYFSRGISGVLPHGADEPTVIECVLRVADGELWVPHQLMRPYPIATEFEGAQVHDRFTPAQMQSTYSTVLELSMWVRASDNNQRTPLLSDVELRVNEAVVRSLSLA